MQVRIIQVSGPRGLFKFAVSQQLSDHGHSLFVHRCMAGEPVTQVVNPKFREARFFANCMPFMREVFDGLLRSRVPENPIGVRLPRYGLDHPLDLSSEPNRARSCFGGVRVGIGGEIDLGRKYGIRLEYRCSDCGSIAAFDIDKGVDASRSH